MSYKYSIFETNWGYFGLFGTDKTLLRTSLPEISISLAKKVLLANFDEDNIKEGAFPTTQKLITDYYKGSYTDFSNVSVNLDRLTPFARDILTACRKITYNQIISYGQLAKLARHQNAGRAAGTALARNPIPLIIPCHRIIRSNGQIGQFSATGGQKTKQKMLDLETCALSLY